MTDFLRYIAPQLADLLRAVATYLDGDEPEQFEDDPEPKSTFRINAQGGIETVSL